MKQETIHIGGIPLSVEVSGAGPRAVIVMHGWGCKAATVRVLADAAAGAGATCRVSETLPNLPRHGVLRSTQVSSRSSAA